MLTSENLAPGPTALGARVKALREGMDLSLRDLSERSGVSAPMLSQVERGETSPTLQVATRIAGGLELRLSQLLRLDERGAVSVVRRRCTNPAAARPRWSSPVRSCCCATATGSSWPPATASRSMPICPTTSRTPEARKPSCSRS